MEWRGRISAGKMGKRPEAEENNPDYARQEFSTWHRKGWHVSLETGRDDKEKTIFQGSKNFFVFFEGRIVFWEQKLFF